MKVRSALLAAAAAMLLFQAPGASAQSVTIKFVSGAPETSMKGRSAIKLAELVEKYTDGDVKLELFPGGQLIPDPDELRAVSRGQVGMAAPYTSYVAALDQSWDIFHTPLIFNDPVEAADAFSGQLGQNLKDSIKAPGLTPLSIWHDGPVYLFTNGSEPITSVKDMPGKRVRIIPNRPVEDMLVELGAVPVTMTAGETFLALQQNAVDIVLTTATYALPAQWHEALKSGTRMLWGHGAYILFVNTRTLDSLTDTQREGFMRAVAETEEWSGAEARENFRKAEEGLAEKGLVWHELSDEERAEWREVAEKVWAKQPESVRGHVETATNP